MSQIINTPNQEVTVANMHIALKQHEKILIHWKLKESI